MTRSPGIPRAPMRRYFGASLVVLATLAWWPGSHAYASNRSTFALADGSGSTSLVVPYFDSDSSISIKNVGTSLAIVTIEYYDLAGADQTPGSNTFTLVVDATVRWAPSAGSPASLDSIGDPIPTMLGPGTTGGAIITSAEPLAGHLEIERVGETVGFTLGPSGGATILRVPYLRPGSSIALRNGGASNATYVVDYRDLSGALITSTMHTLGVDATDYFAPFADEPGLMGSEASAVISSDQPLTGQLEFAGSVDNGGYTLHGLSGSSSLAIPYIRTGSFIAITNVGASSATFTVEYRDLSGGFLAANVHALAANVTERWQPFVDEPGVTGTEVNAVITSDQPLIGHLESSLSDGSTSVSRLTSGTTVLAVPYMRDGSSLRIKSVSGGATSITVTYSDPAGVGFTAAPVAIGAGATEAWDPFADELGLAGMNVASASIAGVDSLVGELELAPPAIVPSVPVGNAPTILTLMICLSAGVCFVLRRVPRP